MKKSLITGLFTGAALFVVTNARATVLHYGQYVLTSQCQANSDVYEKASGPVGAQVDVDVHDNTADTQNDGVLVMPAKGHSVYENVPCYASDSMDTSWYVYDNATSVWTLAGTIPCTCN